MKSSSCAWALLAASALAFAQAGIPMLDAQCPGDIAVHAAPSGMVYVNGRASELKRLSDDHYEASDATSGVVISITGSPDGTGSVSYTGRDGAHGTCAVSPSQAGGADPVTAPAPAAVVHGMGQFPEAETACLDAIARKTRVARDKLRITDVSWAQAGVGVTVKVPDAEAPWSCLANEKGRVQGVSYTGPRL